MELRPGYKQTEVGVIPSDWIVDELGHHVSINSGESPSRFKFKSEGLPYFKVDQLNNGEKYQVETPYFFESGKTVPHGSLIFPKRGASILLNKIRILTENSFMDTNLMTLTPAENLDSEYLFYALLHIQLWRVADTTSIPQINNKHIKPLIISIPPLPEQKSIATTLSDVDALISGLDQLISKKRDIKQAAMQQLLTGQTRLPGFCGEWEVKTFGDVLTGFSSGATPYRAKKEYYKGDISWITSGELNYNLIIDTNEKITKQAVEQTNLKILPKGTFLMAITGLEAAGTRGSCGIVGVEAATNQSCMALFSTERLVTEYLFHYYVLRGDTLALQYCQGTKQQSYTASIVKRLPINLPPTVKEQIAIASILSDMDAELAALEQRRDKTRDLKQGMMQELLTGRVRLNQAEAM